MELLAFLSPSPMEIAVIAVIALIVLGPSKLPEAARSLGRGVREMRDSFQGNDDDHRRLDDDRYDEDDDADLDLGEDSPDEAHSDEPAPADSEPAEREAARASTRA